MEMELISARMAKFMKVSLLIMRSSEPEWRFIRMGICIWESFRMAKSMEMVTFFGLICRARTPKKTSSWSTTTVNGGAVFLMAKASISASTVNIFVIQATCTQATSKTDLNTVKDANTFQTASSTKANTSTDCQKATANTYGKTEAITKATLSKVCVTVMAFGDWVMG